ncbi:hypothetical protein ACSQ67_007611 [Phaseolus vulgaris]
MCYDFSSTSCLQWFPFDSLQTNKTIEPAFVVKERHCSAGEQSTPLLKASVNIPTPSSEKKKVDSFAIAKHDVESFGDTNAFRPTTPGNSPGVGHRKFATQDKDMKATVAVESPDVKVHVTEGTESGFKPTNPGHSPGVGHAQHNQIGQ